MFLQAVIHHKMKKFIKPCSNLSEYLSTLFVEEERGDFKVICINF